MMRNNKGFTLIELITVIVCIGILAILAMPIFVNIAGNAETSAEDEMVGHVRTGLQLFRAQEMVNGTTVTYPLTLDDASVGQSAANNPFFSNVTQNPYRGSGWQKQDSTTYIGPAGNTYVYDNSSGAFARE